MDYKFKRGLIVTFLFIIFTNIFFLNCNLTAEANKINTQFPLYFIQNKGQINKEALFYIKTSNYTLWVTEKKLIFDIIKRANSQNSNKVIRDISTIEFIDINKDVEIKAFELQKLRVSYFRGKDKSEWFENIPTYKYVVYKNIYPNIDLKIYGKGVGIEYDWIINKGGDPKKIKFQYQGIKNSFINKRGDIEINTRNSIKLVHKKPYSYQNDNKIQSYFQEENNIFSFNTGNYDKRKSLIIDPVIVYSSFIGGDHDDEANSVAVDKNGIAYITGNTYSDNFPNQNGYKETTGQKDVFITKIDTSKTGKNSIVYSSFIGGEHDDEAKAIAVDENGIACITGSTYSNNFPNQNGYKETTNQRDIFITKIDTKQTGKNSILYSAFIGGEHDDEAKGIDIDKNGFIYITGYTFSKKDFPFKNSINNYSGSADAFITKIDTSKTGKNSIVYSTFIGGEHDDKANAIAVDKNGIAYITGSTYSDNFPNQNGYKKTTKQRDTFITKINTSKTGKNSILYSAFIGGDHDDEANSIAVDKAGIAYITGSTYSNNFPNQNGYKETTNQRDIFITQVDTKQTGKNSILYSAFIGGKHDDEAKGIDIDKNGFIYITGYTFSKKDFPVKNPINNYSGSADAFITKIDTSKTGKNSIVYSTFIGGDHDDKANAIAVDKNGVAYITGNTYSDNFPNKNGYKKTTKQKEIFLIKLKE